MVLVYRRIILGIWYFTGAVMICLGSHRQARSADPGTWESYVSKYGKVYPSLNNRWTVDGFVGSKNPNTFKYIEVEFTQMSADSAKLREMLTEVKESKNVIITVDEIDEYLGRWKAVLYLLQSVHESGPNGSLPVETMRSAAAGQMEVLFKDAAVELPELMTRIDSQIRDRNSPDDQCLLCKYMAKKIEAMTAVSESQIGLKVAVNQSKEFLSQLMKLQVRGTLLYDMTCSPEDIACRQKIVTLERSLQLQSQKLSNCTPMLMTELSRRSIAHDLYFVNLLSNEILYVSDTETLSSQKGTVDLTEAHVRGCAFKCGEIKYNAKDPSVWKVEDASQYGTLGYYIRGKDDCYLGFDRTFLSFIQKGLNDPNAAGAKEDEVLLCRPDSPPNRKTQSFSIEPADANYTSVYKLKNVLTGKYLRSIRTNELLTDDETGGYIINLVLHKCDENQLGCTWGIAKEPPRCDVRDSVGFMDMFILKLYILLMGVLFIMLIASLVVIWLYRKQIRRDYLQYRRVHTQEIVIPPSYRFPSRT